MNLQLKEQTKEFKELFFLEFTRELIKNISENEVSKLKKIIEDEKEESEKKEKNFNRTIKQKIGIPEELRKETTTQRILTPIKTKFKEKLEIDKGFEKSVKSSFKEFLPEIKRKEMPKKIPILRIPEPILPERLQYLKPKPNKKQINLEKLNPLVVDPLIKVIECNGPDENIVIRGKRGVKKTNISLSKEEIDEVIKNFSEVAKIPVSEGIVRIVYGNLILNAAISPIVGTKFIIRKMAFNLPPPPPPLPTLIR
jgi:hypothetical protein